jgi:hypothetical protein
MTDVKYFKSQVFSLEEDEISYSEALNRGSYVVCHYSDNTPDFAELIGHGKVNRVVYYNRKCLDKGLLKQHFFQYKDCPFEVILLPVEIDGKHIRDRLFCNSAGQLQAITEEHLNSEGDLIREVHMDSQRNLYGSIEYEYDASGELSIVRELAPDGTVISEDDDYY